MKTETRLALTIFLCAALIAGAFTLRDSGMTGLATEGTANLAPEYSTASLSTPSGTALTVDLAKYFTDPDGDALTFLATDEDMVRVSIEGSIATFVPAPGFAGERVITVVATDGTNVVRAPVKLVVGSEEEPVAAAEAPAVETSTVEETPLAPAGIMGAGTQGELGTMDVADNCEPGPVLINTSTTLTQNIASNDTCLQANSDNLAVNCAGFSISFNEDGENQEYGVFAKNHTNITVEDCVILDLNASGEGGGGINFTDVNGSTINNNTITTNGTNNNNGIFLGSTSTYPSNNNTIANNTINSTSGANGNRGIMLYNYAVENNITSNTIMDSVCIITAILLSTGSSQNNVSGNNISIGSAGDTGIYGISSHQSTNNITANSIIVKCTNDCKGLYFFDSSYNVFKANNVTLQYGTNNGIGISIYSAGSNTIEGNTISTNGTYNNYGIGVQAVSNYNVIGNNTILSTGNQYNNTGILVSVGSTRNNITGNNITTNGSSVSHGIYVDGGSNDNVFIGNNVSSSGVGSAGIFIKSSNGTTFDKNTLTTTPVWINTTQDTHNNFTNTTFATDYGSINIPDRVEINESQEISQGRLNITNNKAFLNSSNLTFLNGTGIITLNGLAFTNPKPSVDWNDTSTYEDCPSEVCTELGYSGGVFVFNVSHFTGFMAAEAGEITGCPATINTSTTLTQNIISNTSCITIGNDSIVLDCAGHSIRYNAQGVNNAFGIASNNTGNITIRNCSIIGINKSGNYTVAINLSWVNNSLITNNTIIGNGSDNNFAILMESSPNMLVENNTIRIMPLLENNSALVMRAGSNSTISNNTIIAGGTYLGHGIIINASHSNRFNLNNITTSASLSYAVKLEGSNHSIFTKTILCNATNWITSSDNTQNNFTNTTFEGDTAAINLPGKFELNGSDYISIQKLNLTGFRAFLNSTNLTYLNTTGIITIYGLVTVNPEPAVDWYDLDSYVSCPADVCTELSYVGNTYVFNVTHFTKYTALEGAVMGCPVTINQSTTLTQSLVSNDSCITINASNATLDCAGFSISYNANGTNSEFGIIAADVVNITVTNCNIRDINSTGQFNIAINFTNVNDSTIDSNNITANGTFGAQAIVMLGNMTRNVITDNIINTFGTGSTNWGIALLGDIALTNITGNEIATNGSGSAYGISLDGGNVSETRITGNRVSTQGTGSSNHGIVLSYANNTIIANNNITATGALLSDGLYMASSFNAVENNTITAPSGKNNSGMYVGNGTFNNFTSNTISTNGTTDNFGIILNNSADTNVFRFNNITTNGSGSYCVYITNSNGTFYNTLLNHTGEWTGDWIYSFKVAGGSNIFSNFTNTTMATNYGSVNFPGVVEISNILDVTRTRLDVTANQTHMNSVALQAFNTTGIITLYGISYIDPEPIVDWADTGTYLLCPDSVCAELGYAGGVYVFNVSHFTTYSIKEANTFNITACPVSVNTSARLSQNITFAGVSPSYCVQLNSDDIVLDCENNWINRSATGGNTVGIYAINRRNITIKNCRIDHDNDDDVNDFSGIDVNRTNSSLILNNTILFTINSSDPSGPDANCIVVDGNDNTILNNTVNASIDSLPGPSYLYGLDILGSRNNLTGNAARTIADNIGSSYGRTISLRGDNHTVSNNSFTALGISTDNYALYANANRSVFVNNTISGNSTYAIRLIGVNNCSFNITTINVTQSWISRASSAENNFTNTTFVMGNGSINVLGTFDGTTTLISDLNITYNAAFINASEHQELNQSAIITLYGSTYVNPKPRVDWNDDGTYEDCPSDICAELGYSGGVFVFNVSHFTGYSSSETPLSNASNLTLTKTDNPDPVNVSSNLTYQINVSITGNGTAYNVTVIDTYPAEVIYLTSQPAPVPPLLLNYTWSLGDLAQGTNYSINITVLVLNITNGSVINNTVNVTFQNESSSNLSTNVSISTTVLNPLLYNLSNISVTKTDSPDPVNASSNLTYQINVTSSGTGTAYNVTVNETYPNQSIYLTSQPDPLAGTNNTWILGNLSVGTNISINITLLVLNISNGSLINNTVNVTFNNETSASLSANASASTTVLNPPLYNFSNISATKTDSPDPVNVSSNLTYQINVTSSGNGTAYNVTVNDTYPNQTIYLTSQPSPLSGTNNTWILGNLSVGTNISINITLLVLNITNGSLINNTVNVTFNNETSASLGANASASTTVLNPPLYNLSNISITKTGSPDPVTAGDSLSYTITVNSTGNGTAYNVTVNDTYPAPVVYSTSQPTPLAGTNNTWILGNLTSGTVIVINVTVTVPASVTDGAVLNNTVNATFNNETSALLSGNASSTTTVTVTPPTPGGGSGGGGRIVPRTVISPEAVSEHGCVESWECEDWTRCDEGSQSRACVDLNNCNKTANLPQTERKCLPESAEVPAEKSPVTEMPALEPVPAPVSASEPVVEPVTVCSVLPMSLEAALIIAGLLALVSLLAGRKSRMLKRWRLPVDALLAACLALSVWHYLSCRELLLVETIALGVLALFVITLRAADFIASRRHPAEESAAPVIEPEEMPEVPLPEEEIPVPEPEEIPVPEQVEVPEEIPVPEPEEIPEPIVMPKPAMEPEMPQQPRMPQMPKVIIPMLEEVVRQKRKKPAEKIIITSPKKQQKQQRKKKRLKVKVAPPVLEEGMRDWRDVVRRTGKTLRKLDSTLRRLKKKK